MASHSEVEEAMSGYVQTQSQDRLWEANGVHECSCHDVVELHRKKDTSDIRGQCPAQVFKSWDNVSQVVSSSYEVSTVDGHFLLRAPFHVEREVKHDREMRATLAACTHDTSSLLSRSLPRSSGGTRT